MHEGPGSNPGGGGAVKFSDGICKYLQPMTMSCSFVELMRLFVGPGNGSPGATNVVIHLVIRFSIC